MASGSVRWPSIDALRGAVMVLMTLDHVREYLHADASAISPEDLAQTTLPLFLTRWVTHFCAPVFAFTAGLGAGLAFGGRPAAERVWPIASRGLWLMLLEVTVMRWILLFRWDHPIVPLTILWGLGGAMLLLAGLARGGRRVVTGAAVGGLLLLPVLSQVPPALFGPAAGIWSVLARPMPLAVAGHTVIPAYSWLPWCFVMAAGYAAAPLWTMEAARRRCWLLALGGGAAATFLVLRALNLPGDPSPWATQSTFGMTAASFLRVSKYPPSLFFVLMTLGPALLVLAAFERRGIGERNPLVLFGRAPLFYFLAHLLTIHLLAVALAWWRYGDGWIAMNPPPGMAMDGAYPPGYGYGLGAVWLMAAGVAVGLYPLCAWFARYKRGRAGWWWRYL